MNDQQRDYKEEHFNDIRSLYKQFKPERRIIFYDIEDGKYFAFPYKKYKKTLNKRSRIILKKQYEDARKNNQIVVFVSDSKLKTLKSYFIDEKEHRDREPHH